MLESEMNSAARGIPQEASADVLSTVPIAHVVIHVAGRGAHIVSKPVGVAITVHDFDTPCDSGETVQIYSADSPPAFEKGTRAMNVESIATRDVVTVKESDSMRAASNIFKEHKFRHLPVVDDGGRLVGVVTDRDIKRASASDATSLDIHELTYLVDKITVSRVMTKEPIVVAPDTSVQAAAKLMADRKIGCLPVMVDGKLGGIVTDIDMLKLLARGG